MTKDSNGVSALWLAIVLTILLLPIYFLPEISINRDAFLAYHQVAELFSIVVSMLVFAVGWNTSGYSPSDSDGNNTILSACFLGVALLDLGHTLSYPSMPNFVTPSDGEKSIDFWLSARLIGAFGLLMAAIRPWYSFAHRWNRAASMLLVLTYVALVYWAILFHLEDLPRTFIVGLGLTNLKIGLEYTVVAMLGVAVVALWNSKGTRRRWLIGAVIVLAASELPFTLYTKHGDIFNTAGHAYKFIGFAMLYYGLFLETVREPYRRLAERGVQLTEQTKALERSNAELEQFAYIASHDLREPLRMVSSYVDLLKRRYGDILDADGLEFIAFAKEGAVRMDHQVQDLLDLSRVGRVSDPLQPNKLGDLVARAAKNLQHAIEEANAEVNVSADLAWIICSGSEIVRLLQNLIGNAIKFRGAGRHPTVKVSCSRKGEFWEITVADNGIGIEPAYFERIFSIFQRLHTRGEYDGTGIGLAICKKIVERHGGRIWLTSTFGQGSTFFFTLPLSDVDAAECSSGPPVG